MAFFAPPQDAAAAAALRAPPTAALAPAPAFAAAPGAAVNAAEELRGTGISPDGAAHVFFSRANLDAVQATVRAVVHARAPGNPVIARQSDRELLAVMRAVYLEHSRWVGGEDPREEARRLDRLVVEFVCERVLSELRMFSHFAANFDRNPVPLPPGFATSCKGERQLETKTFFGA